MEMTLRKWVFGVLCVIAMLAVLPALAQAPAGKSTEAPFSPATVDEEIEASAKAARERGDAASARYRKFVIRWADDPDEYGRMANYAVMLLTVISQDSRDLPVDRVYVRAGSSDVVVRKLWSQRREVPIASLTAKMYGRNREDAIYLVPGGRLMAEGALQADLTARRSPMAIAQLPTEHGRKYHGLYPSADPGRRAKPDAATFKAFMERNFPGYPLPKP